MEKDPLVLVGSNYVRRSAIWEVGKPSEWAWKKTTTKPWEVVVLIDKRYEGRAGEIRLGFDTKELAEEFVRSLVEEP